MYLIVYSTHSNMEESAGVGILPVADSVFDLPGDGGLAGLDGLHQPSVLSHRGNA